VPVITVNKTGTEDIWWILEGQDYPRLFWEPTEAGEQSAMRKVKGFTLKDTYRRIS